MRYYIVWLRNTTDIRDDEPVKILAESKEEAIEIASKKDPWRFTVRYAMTLKQFKRFEPWWHSHFWGRKAWNENG